LVAGLAGSARSLLVSIMNESMNRPILLITHQLFQAQQLYDDLTELMDEKDVYLYPVNELIATEIAVASPELRSQRIEALTSWTKKQSGILIAPVAAMKRILPPVSYWSNYQLDFEVGKEIDIESNLSTLVKMGYERTEMVTTPGEFSQRGGIIDIYPVTKKYPYRIELFDDEIDSIRYFDAESQRSLEKQDQARIDTASELLLTKEDVMYGVDRMEKALANTLKKVNTASAKEELVRVIDHDIDRLK